MRELRSMWLRACRGMLALGFLVGITRPALAAVVTFESLNAPGNGTGGLLLKNQLAGDGIVFQGVTALDYSQGIAIPNFTHSGTKAVELCYAAEFCTGPLDFSFTTAQRRVKVWVGYSWSLTSAQTVVLRAYDIFGNQVGSATQILGPSTGVIPVATSLQVSVPVLPRIVRATVGFLGAEASPATIFNNSLVVDDIEFDTQGPPPACQATQPPGIGLIAPIDGLIVVQNSFTVELNLVTPDPFATIQVSATGSTQTNTFGPVFAAQGHVIYAGITGLLFPGANTVRIQARDCFGQTERIVTVNYRNDVTQTPILVIDEANFPVPAAEVYANGVLLGRTDTSGMLNASPPLGDGTSIVAKRFIVESTTYRGNHAQGSYQDWKFRAYTSNVAVQNDGSLTTFSVKLEPNPLAPQVVRVLKQNALIGLHVVASVEWDASTAELETVKQKLINASRFLYNATDGQVLIERADVVDDGAVWEDADYRVYANQSLRENVDCPLGAFFDDSFWCNGSWVHVQIGSDGPTYAHEFGHYGFDLGDEYSDDDSSVQCTFALSLGTNPPGLNPFQAGMPAASCMMFYQWSAPKLCSNRSGNPHVHGTDQGDDSCWSTLIDHFKDDRDNPRWTLQSPDTRGAILGTINGTNPPLPAWAPQVVIDNHTRPNLCAPLTFTATDDDGNPQTGREIWLHTTYGADILEGKTNDAGQLTGTGLHAGDQVENLTLQIFDCSPVARLAPRGPLLSEPGLVTVSQKQTAPPPTPPSPPLRGGEQLPPRTLVLHKPAFRVFASLTPGAEEKSAELRVWAESLEGKPVPLKGAPEIRTKLGGRREPLKAPLRYDSEAHAYAGALTNLPIDVELAVEITATDRNGQTQRSMVQFQMSRPDPEKDSKIFSADGQLQLTVPARAMPRGARVSVGPGTVRPPSTAADEVLLVGPFRVAADHLTKFARPATLKFRLPHSRRQPGMAGYQEKGFRVLQLDPASGTWVERQAVVHPFPVDEVIAKIDSPGTFVLAARREAPKPDQKE